MVLFYMGDDQNIFDRETVGAIIFIVIILVVLILV